MVDEGDRQRLEEARRSVRVPRGLYHFAEGRLESFPNHAELEERVRQRLLAKDPDQVTEGLSGVLHWLHQVDGLDRDEIYSFRSAVRRWSMVEALRLFDWVEGPGLILIENLRLPSFRELSTASSLRMFLDPARRVSLRPVHLRLRALQGPSVLHQVEGEGDRWPLTLFNEVCYERWCQICAGLAQLFGEEAWRPVDVERSLAQLIHEGESPLALRLVHLGESLRELG